MWEAVVEPRVTFLHVARRPCFRSGLCAQACVRWCVTVSALTCGRPGCLSGRTFVTYSFVFSCFSGSGVRLGWGWGFRGLQNCCFSPFLAVGDLLPPPQHMGGHGPKQLLGGRGTCRNVHTDRPICVREGTCRQEHTPLSWARVGRHRPMHVSEHPQAHTHSSARGPVTELEPVSSHEHTQPHAGI